MKHPERATTHYEGCWMAAGHHECAKRHIRGLESLNELTFHQEAGQISVEVRNTYVEALTALMAGWFEDHGGISYVEMQAFHPKLGAFTMTVQRLYGMSPAQKVDALMQVLDEITAYQVACANICLNGPHKPGCPYYVAAPMTPLQFALAAMT